MWQQVLLFNGNLLVSRDEGLSKKISDFNIQKESTIRLTGRLRGGALELADVNMEEIIMTEY